MAAPCYREGRKLTSHLQRDRSDLSQPIAAGIGAVLLNSARRIEAAIESDADLAKLPALRQFLYHEIAAVISCAEHAATNLNGVLIDMEATGPGPKRWQEWLEALRDTRAEIRGPLPTTGRDVQRPGSPPPTDSELVALRWLQRECGDEFGSGKLAVLYEQRYRKRALPVTSPVISTSRRVSWARTSGREMARMCRKGLLRLVSVDGRTSSSFTDGRRTYGLTDEAREAIR